MHTKKQSVTVNFSDIVPSTSRNAQVLHMCMVRTYHTKRHTKCQHVTYANITHQQCHVLHMRTVVHVYNAPDMHEFNCSQPL